MFWLKHLCILITVYLVNNLFSSHTRVNTPPPSVTNTRARQSARLCRESNRATGTRGFHGIKEYLVFLIPNGRLSSFFTLDFCPIFLFIYILCAKSFFVGL